MTDRFPTTWQQLGGKYNLSRLGAGGGVGKYKPRGWGREVGGGGVGGMGVRNPLVEL